MGNSNVLIIILKLTAWKMESPVMYGSLHIACVIILTAAAVLGSRHFAGRDIIRVLGVTGRVLLLLEVYKQLFLYYIVNGGAYDYWYFPFQLCSVPMYLCLLLPLLDRAAKRFGFAGRLRDSSMTFMTGYTFVSAAATFVFPEDLLRPYISLTLHGFIWHGVLLFISLTLLADARAAYAARRAPDGAPSEGRPHADLSRPAFARATVLFAALSAISIALNCILEVLASRTSSVYASGGSAHAALANSYPNMFYMSPYHISTQPLIGTIQKAAGIPAGLIVYALAIIALSGMVTLIMRRLSEAPRAR